ncbi:MAG: CPBP family intramembrane metalloprotease [Bacteroidetes bacterium]|nr:CPBP family intramembrane metalloprotease [Bacteroidota bacterium]
MNYHPLFGQTHTGFKLFLFLGLMLLSTLLVMVLSLLIGSLVFGLPFQDLLFKMGQPQSESGLEIARFMQIGSQMGLFVLPPILFALLVSRPASAFLGFRLRPNGWAMVAALLLMFTALPLIHEMGEWNKLMKLPQWLSGLEDWMKEKEELAGVLTEAFLRVNAWYLLLFNLLMIALIPAVGEELVFRSVLQPLLGKGLRSIHAGIVISALLFSAMHMQFYGLLPRFALGLLLGYAYYWSGSIWLPMAMHFVNNGAAVVVYYLHFNGFIETAMEDFGTPQGSLMLIVSMLLSAALVYGLYRLKLPIASTDTKKGLINDEPFRTSGD